MKTLASNEFGGGVCLVPEVLAEKELIRDLLRSRIRAYSSSGDGREIHVHLTLEVNKEETRWPLDMINLTSALHDLATPAGSRPWSQLEPSEKFERLQRAEKLLPILRSILK